METSLAADKPLEEWSESRAIKGPARVKPPDQAKRDGG